MGLDQAIADMKKYTQAGFSREITFTKPDHSQSAIVRGLVSKHNLGINPATGAPINSRNAHISVVESLLIEAPYNTRDDKGEINIKGDMVSWVDASGVPCKYLIDETMMSHTLGLIVCTLGEMQC